MSILLHSFRKFTLLEFKILLCFLLPPLGIFLLLLIGLHTIRKFMKEKKNFVFSLSSYFFLCLFISTIGAAMLMKELSYLVISVMILGYWGLYLRIMETERNQLFKHFQLIMVFGAIYSCVIGWISKWCNFPLPVRYLTGTIFIGQNDYTRLIGCEYNSNFTVFILLIAISFLLAYLLTSFRRKFFFSFVWQIPIVILLSYGVIQTGSRTGFASMILIYLLFILRLNRTFFMITAFISIVLLKWFLHLMPRSESVIHAIHIRQDIWINGFRIWQNDSFFGVTPIGFSQEYLKHYKEFVPHAHSMFIGMFAEYGTVGGLAFLIVICINLVKCIQLFFPIRSKKCLLDSFLLGLPIIIFTGVFDEPLFSPQIGLLTVILLACWDRYTKGIHFFITSPLKSKNKFFDFINNVLVPKNHL